MFTETIENREDFEISNFISSFMLKNGTVCSMCIQIVVKVESKHGSLQTMHFL